MAGLGRTRESNGAFSFLASRYDGRDDATYDADAARRTMHTPRPGPAPNSTRAPRLHAAAPAALMTATATEILTELPKWFSSVGKLGEEMGYIFSYLQSLSEGMIVAQGHGLMWGCLFTAEGDNADETARAETVVAFKNHCEDLGVLPYFVPVGGFMVTPVVDVDVGTIYEIGTRLEEALRRTMRERGWNNKNNKSRAGVSLDVKSAASATPTPTPTPTPATSVSPIGNDLVKQSNINGGGGGVCSTQFHVTRSCTSCTNFVCRDVRMRFLHSTS